MAKSYFAILEITSNATPDEIHSAYRRLAKEFHPDYYRGGSEPFRQIQEAYSVLGDPARRKAYKERLTNVRVRRTPDIVSKVAPEPLIPENASADIGEISPVRSFETFSPSFDEIFDWLWNNFSTVDHPKSGRVQNLTLEIPLDREQARRGGHARVMVPARSVCPTCRGYGAIGYYECHRCAGEGAISGEVPISVAFPPGLMKDHSVIIPLDRFGIKNLHCTVLFRPRDVG
jgi:DnaJ-class molecular chaperone